ncbi:MAG: hypothetical protein WC694_03715 [Candidatus Paceibacterota bacterium]|jgi:hypothetical protein
MSNEKKIIIASVVFLFTSVSFLFYSENQRLRSADSGWEVYFQNPQSNDLTFIIKNNGKAKKFHWKKIIGNNVATQEEADSLVPAGQEKSIAPLFGADTPRGEKIITEVLDESGRKKEIYKLIK